MNHPDNINPSQFLARLEECIELAEQRREALEKSCYDEIEEQRDEYLLWTDNELIEEQRDDYRMWAGIETKDPLE